MTRFNSAVQRRLAGVVSRSEKAAHCLTVSAEDLRVAVLRERLRLFGVASRLEERADQLILVGRRLEQQRVHELRAAH